MLEGINGLEISVFPQDLDGYKEYLKVITCICDRLSNAIEEEKEEIFEEMKVVYKEMTYELLILMSQHMYTIERQSDRFHLWLNLTDEREYLFAVYFGNVIEYKEITIEVLDSTKENYIEFDNFNMFDGLTANDVVVGIDEVCYRIYQAFATFVTGMNEEEEMEGTIDETFELIEDGEEEEFVEVITEQIGYSEED